MSSNFYPENVDFLNVDPRMYKFIRLTAIKNIEDAVLETVTNSIDAYNRMEVTGLNKDEIELDYSTRVLSNRDQALGMNAADMQAKLLTIGAYSSSVGTRGFFSRGVKDLSALGNVVFDCIKDGLYSKAVINTQGQAWMEISDVPVTTEHRTETGIVENGTLVRIYVKDIITLPAPDTLLWNIENHYGMRDIVNDVENEIKLTTTNYSGTDGTDVDKVLSFDNPTGTEIVNMEFHVPGYPEEATATFKLYQSETPIEEPENEKYIKFGILVKSDVGIHENSCLYSILRYHPKMSYLFGELTCPYIQTLMYDIDNNGESELNPFPIIDHSRQNGLVSGHPFRKALFAIPYARISYILESLNAEEDDDGFQPENIKNILHNLELFGDAIFKPTSTQTPYYLNNSVEGLTRAIARNNSSSGNILTEDEELKYSLTAIQGQPPTDNFAEPQGLNFKIKFTNTKLNFRYIVYRQDENLIMKIYSGDPALTRFVDQDADGEVDWHRKEARVVISEMITEALARSMVEYELVQKGYPDLSDLGPVETFQAIWKRYESAAEKIEAEVYNIILSDFVK